MATALRIPKAQIVLMVVLPLAVVLGYFLANPLDQTSMNVVGLVLAALILPLVMQWYHTFLIVFWNATIALLFVPGTPHLWMFVAALGFMIAVLNRSVNPDFRFISLPPVTWSLFFLMAVVFITAYFNGGIGSQILGSSKYGGRRYAYMACAVIGYFALTSQRISPHRAALLTTLFFVSSLTALVPDVLGLLGSTSSILYLIFPPDLTTVQAVTGESAEIEMFRIVGLTAASSGVFFALIARYGLRGILDHSRPWRIALFLLAISAGVYSGFRGTLVVFVITFGVQFFVEGLHKTKWLGIMGGIGLLAAGIIFTQAEKLPLVVQRTISFLHVKVSPVAQASADASSQWRLTMWKRILPTVPSHLLMGKGYSINPTDLYFSGDARTHGETDWAIITGDYHNGPLSIVLPFGIWGLAAFVYFCVAALRFLYANFRFGNPELRKANTFIFVYFISKIIFFTFFFGSFWSDLFVFTGLIGLSVSLNGTQHVLEKAPQSADIEEEFLQRAYRDDFA
jgi:hypothetical protein